MKHYTVSNSVGSVESSDITGEKEEDEKDKKTTTPADTVKEEPILRPQAVKHRRVAP